MRSSTADGLFNERADLFVLRFAMDDAMAFEQAAGVCVHDEDRVITGIKQDGVGGLRANAIEGQQFSAKSFRRLGKHTTERTRVMLVEKADEGLEFLAFWRK